MEINDLVASLSAVGSLLAALWARSSAISARKALILAKEESESKKESLSTYLIDAIKWLEGDSQPYIAASCSITNSSSSPTTIKSIELLVHAIDKAGTQASMYIPTGTSTPVNSNFSLIKSPLNLEARTSTTGWLSFKLPESLKGSRVTRYEIILQTWSGQKNSLHIYQVKKIK